MYRNLQTIDGAYIFCESCVKSYEFTGDEMYLNALCEGMFSGPRFELDTKKYAKHGIMVSSNPHDTHTEIDGGQYQNATPEQLKKMQELKTERKMLQARNAGWENMTAGRKLRYNAGVIGKGLNRNKGKIAAGAAIAGLAGYALKKKSDADYKDKQLQFKDAQIAHIKAQAAHQSKSWISKKIAALRSIYQNYLQKARIAKANGQASIFQKVASKILGVIDYLTAKLQHAVE